MALITDPDAILEVLLEATPIKLVLDPGESPSDGAGAMGEVPMCTFLDDVTVGGSETIYLSKKGFITESGDTPASTLYEPRLLSAHNFQTSIPTPTSGEAVGGSRVAFGAITINNADGLLDKWVDRGWEGREVMTYLGGTTSPDQVAEDILTRSEYTLLLKAIVSTLNTTSDTITLNLRDPAENLKAPINETVYLGTGGREGDEDQEGVPKPLLFGLCRNVTPVPIDHANLIYQVHDGSIDEVLAVRDRGIPLTAYNGGANDVTDLGGEGVTVIEDWDPTGNEGTYITELASGLIRTGAPPTDAGGRLTADIKGDDDSTYIDDTPSIIRRIVDRYTTLVDPADVDTSSFTSFSNTGTVGFYTGTTSTDVLRVVDQLAYGADGTVTFLRDGKMTLVEYIIPEGATPVATIENRRIIRISTRTAPSTLFRVRIQYRRNWTVQDPDTLTGELDIDAEENERLKDEYSNDYRCKCADNAAAKSVNGLAREIELNTFFDLEADASTILTAKLNRGSTKRKIYTIILTRFNFQFNVGDVVRIAVDEQGSKSTIIAIVYQIIEDLSSEQTTIEAWA